MPKASASDFTPFGFRSDMFGPEAEDYTAFVNGILSDVEVTVKGQVGATKYASSTYADALKLAEKYLAAAELSRRRITHLSGNLNADTAGADIAALRNNIKDYEGKAAGFIGSVVAGKVEEGASFSSGVVITGDLDTYRLSGSNG